MFGRARGADGELHAEHLSKADCASYRGFHAFRIARIGAQHSLRGFCANRRLMR